MVLSADLTLRTCSLGDRDLKTGWCAKTFTETTIKGILEAKGATHYAAAHGLYTNKPFSLWTASPVAEDDEIKDQYNEYYVIEAVSEIKKLDCFEGYFCGLTLRDPHYDREATSGTWHQESAGTPPESDVRYRTKYWYEAHDATIYKDNGSPAATKIMFSEPDYQWWREFVTNNIDAVAYISAVNSKPLIHGQQNSPYAFDETVTIALRTVNKTGITAT